MKNLKKLTAIGLAILVAFTIVGYQEVSAEEANNAGCFNVTNTTSGATSTDGWSYSTRSSSQYITISKSGEYYIEQNCDCTGDYHYGRLTIENAVDVTITLVNVEIKNKTNAPVTIQNSDSNVKFILVGNIVFSTNSQNTSGIMFTPSENGSLTITSDTVAYLTVKGGSESSAIGGGTNSGTAVGPIYITGYVNLSLSGGNGTSNNRYVAGTAIGTANVLADNIEIEIHDCYYDSSMGASKTVTGSGCSINVSGQTLTTSATGPVASASPVESEVVNESSSADVDESPSYTSGLIIVDTASK